LTNKGKYLSRNPLKRFLLTRFLARSRALVGVEAVSVLDVGSGEGLFWEDYVPPKLVALDIRHEALIEGRTRTGALAVEGSVFSLPFDDGSFDLVTAIEVLEHLVDPAAALDEIRRVTRGRLVASVPWEPFFSLATMAGSGKHVRRLGREPEHIQAFGPDVVRALLAERFAGVEVVTCFPWILAHAHI
jgi:SAM-dependent methyltransferase